MTTSCCINDLINHIFQKSKEIFVGTVHEHDWFVYHDALSLLTSQQSIDYMREKGYLRRLILPENGLNNVVNGSTAYAKQVVGNHMRLMPLDEHLNQDLHHSVDLHVIISKRLPNNHPDRFSKRTSKLMSSAYRRIWDTSLGIHKGTPTSPRICEDINRVVDVAYLDVVANLDRALHGQQTY